ncbi:MAG: PKD domain-containing protein [Flavobacteriales bacterium]|nr:PKD domain-containing protein [Flavobacteriales bacterium]
MNGNTWVPYDITVSGTDPRPLAARTSQYGNYPDLNGFVVFRSTNGGTTWTNITDANLNGEWPTNIVHQLGTNGGLYIGTRRAVYLRSDAAPAWTLWNAGLPSKIFSTRLLINYREGKVRNGTDRSVWESSLEFAGQPLANFSADKRTVSCLAPNVQFWDNSALHGTNATWSWSFPGGSPTSSTSRAPLVSYTAAGSYDVTLDGDGRERQQHAHHPGLHHRAHRWRCDPGTADAEDQLVTPEGMVAREPRWTGHMDQPGPFCGCRWQRHPRLADGLLLLQRTGPAGPVGEPCPFPGGQRRHATAVPPCLQALWRQLYRRAARGDQHELRTELDDALFRRGPGLGTTTTGSSPGPPPPPTGGSCTTST